MAVPGTATAPTWPALPPAVPVIEGEKALWTHIAARTPALLAAPPPGEAVWPTAAADVRSDLAAITTPLLTPASLAAAAGHLPVQVETRPTGGATASSSFGRGTRTLLPLGAALARLATDQALYLSAQPPPPPGPGNLPLPAGALALALAAPRPPSAPVGLIPMRPACAAGLIPAAVHAWVGGAAAASGLHADVHDNLLSLVAGTKAVTLFPPAAVGDLATVGTPVRVWPNGRLVFAGEGEDAAADGSSEAGVAEAAARAAQRAAADAVAGAGTDEEEEAALEAALQGAVAGGPGGLDDYEEEEEEDGKAGPPAAASTTPPTFSRADLARPEAVRAAFPSFPWHLAGTVTLRPGQTLFIPAGWFHWVQSTPEPAAGASSPSPWAGLHCAVNHWFHPPDNAVAGGPASPYARPYWAGVWEEALAACPPLREAVEAQERAVVLAAAAAAAGPPTPAPERRAAGGGPAEAPPAAAPADADAVSAALALLRRGLTGLDSVEAGGRAALRRGRQAVLLQALSGRRTRHGAAGVLAWARKPRTQWR